MTKIQFCRASEKENRHVVEMHGKWCSKSMLLTCNRDVSLTLSWCNQLLGSAHCFLLHSKCCPDFHRSERKLWYFHSHCRDFFLDWLNPEIRLQWKPRTVADPDSLWEYRSCPFPGWLNHIRILVLPQSKIIVKAELLKTILSEFHC